MKNLFGTRAARTLCRAAVVGFASGMLVVSLGAQQPTAAKPDTQLTNMVVPPVIHQLKPHEVIEHIISQRHELYLSEAQFNQLSELHKAVRDGKPVTEPTGSTKPPTVRTVVISTPEQALNRAFTYLTPQQQHQSLMLFEKESQK